MKNIVVSIKCGDKTCGLCQFQKLYRPKVFCTAFSKYLDQDVKDEFRLPECIAAECNSLSLGQQGLNLSKESIKSMLSLFSDEEWNDFESWHDNFRYGV